ncbi:MAG: hypothetical protein K9M57_03855 [Phycisphaerae bacterium]|nr:hypothetical protein [Phycisphaerae bacterium]
MIKSETRQCNHQKSGKFVWGAHVNKSGRNKYSHVKSQMPHRRGLVSVLAIFFIILFSVLAISISSVTNTNLMMADNHAKVAQAQAASESGLAYARCLLHNYIHETKPHTFQQSLSASEMTGLFTGLASYAALMLDGSAAIDNARVAGLTSFRENGLTGQQFSIPVIQMGASQESQFSLQFRQYTHDLESIEVKSTGGANTIQRRVQLNYSIVKGTPGLFDFALFAREDLLFNNGVTLDGFNFEADDPPLQAGTNGINSGSIDLRNSASILGDVVVGVGGDPDIAIQLSNGANITGETSVMQEEWEPPLVQVPHALSTRGSSGVLNNTTTINANGKYDSIDLGNRETVRIEGEVELYITGDINLGNAAAIEIAPNAKLTLFLGGNLVLSNGAELNNLTQEVENFMILGLDTCENVILKNSATTYASIYTPNADVDFRNSADAYGAVVSKSFRQHNSAGFHYDADLRESSPVGVSASISLLCDGNSFMEL